MYELFVLARNTRNRSMVWKLFVLDRNKSKSKVGDCSRGQPEGSPFNSYYTEV